MMTSGDLSFTYKLARSLCLAGAVAAGVQPVDGVFADFKDEKGLRAEAEAARREGFTGKLAIHPAQVPIINAAFTPSDDEVRHAEEIVAAFEAQSRRGRAVGRRQNGGSARTWCRRGVYWNGHDRRVKMATIVEPNRTQTGTDRPPRKGWGTDAPDQPLRPMEFERRALRPDDVAIKITYAGICHSDLHTAATTGAERAIRSFPAMRSSAR